MAMRKSGPLDAMVGARIRMLRVNRGISQTVLAERSALPFNRCRNTSKAPTGLAPAGWRKSLPCWTFRLASFSESSRTGPPGLNSPVHLLAEPGAWRALKACARTPSPRVRSLHREAG